MTVTVEQAIAWLKDNTASQDTGASNVDRAIAIFREAVREIEKSKAGALTGNDSKGGAA